MRKDTSSVHQGALLRKDEPRFAVPESKQVKNSSSDESSKKENEENVTDGDEDEERMEMMDSDGSVDDNEDVDASEASDASDASDDVSEDDDDSDDDVIQGNEPYHDFWYQFIMATFGAGSDEVLDSFWNFFQIYLDTKKDALFQKIMKETTEKMETDRGITFENALTTSTKEHNREVNCNTDESDNRWFITFATLIHRMDNDTLVQAIYSVSGTDVSEEKLLLLRERFLPNVISKYDITKTKVKDNAEAISKSPVMMTLLKRNRHLYDVVMECRKRR